MVVERAEDAEHQQHGKEAIQEVHFRIIYFPPIPVLHRLDERIVAVSVALRLLQLHHVGVGLFVYRKIAVFGNGEPVEGVEEEEDIVGEDADDSEQVVDDIKPHEVGISCGVIGIVFSLLHEVVEVELGLAHQQGSHDVDDGKGVQLVGLVDMVVAVREGVGAEPAHLE